MRTDWSVLLVVCGLAWLGGCESSRSGETYAWLPAEAAAEASGEGKPKAGAETTPPAKRRALKISVADAVAESMNANPQVRQARLQEAIARTIERETRSGLLPQLVWRGAYFNRDSAPQAIFGSAPNPITVGPKDVASYRFSLDFPIFAFGRYINAYKASQLSRQASEADTDTSEANIAAAVTAAAFDLLLTQATVGVAKTNEAALLRQVQDSQALLDAGRVTRSALLEAQVSHDVARREREKAESLVAIKRMTLNELLGRSPSMPTEVVDDRTVRKPEFDLAKLTAEALERRPELRSLRLRVEASVRNAKSVLGRWLPELRGAVSYANTNNDFQDPKDVAQLDLTLDVPLYVGGANYAQIKRAKREVEVNRVALEDLQRQIQTEVATAWRSLDEAYKDISVATRSVERSRENLRIQREKFNNGRAISQEVLRATSLLTDSAFSEISATYNFKNALRELHRVRGADPRTMPRTSDPEPGVAGKQDIDADSETDGEKD